MIIGHEMILASAGSGKTYALTNRFVQLLAHGAKPEAIVALTFTRKAAGEFFDAILRKLAAAASDAGSAAELAREIGRPGTGPAEFLGLLREVVDAMHRLKLGTFDGFFARIAKNFPFELGLSGEFEVLEESAAAQAQREVLRRIFARTGGLSDAQQEFVEAFKLATFAQEEKRLADKLGEFLHDHQQVFLDAPDGDLWGNPSRIWPEGCAWPLEKHDLAAAAMALREAKDREPWDDRRREWWERLLAELAAWAPGMEMHTPLANVIKALPDMAAVAMNSKKVAPEPALRDALLTVARVVVGQELVRRLAMTRGIHAVIGGYEEIYDGAVRRRGRLTFADVQRLLQPATDDGRKLATGAGGEGRLLIDYRLDAEIEHWLLDEFQDTSFGQWSALKNLIDEAVQDPEGRRTFFYVGDVKQAIYAWREGDPRLFREIFNHYNEAAPGTIAERHLDRSWRSGPPVIAMVNAVFGSAEVMTGMFPAAAAVAWNREWRAHASARPELAGQAAVLLAEDQEGRLAATLGLLRGWPAPRAGFTVAVLVQKNDTAAELADYLRREGGLAAVAEADLHVCADNPAGAALLALVQAAAHPGDTLAWEHVRMSPLGEALTAGGVGTREALTERLLGRIAGEGFEAALREWAERPELAAPEDGFTRLRLRQFLAAAAEFDAGGSRDSAEFLDFMARHTLREPDSAAVVRVMTIHKAKGLGFDAVILPDLGGNKLAQARDGLAVRRGADHEVQWVLDMPRADIAGCDPTLDEFTQGAEASACYEKLSLLYVAMTRAKRALYAVIERPKPQSKSSNFTKLLTETLGAEPRAVRIGGGRFDGLWAEGDPDWAEQIAPPKPEEAPVPPVVLTVGAAMKSRRLPARRASDGAGGSVAAEMLFAWRSGGSPADFGREAHQLLAEIEWRETAKTPARGEAGRLVRACVQAAAFDAVWTRREGAELWRERTFEAVIDGVWVTGVFDRVIVEHDTAGRPVRAEVFDFKTDEDAVGAVDRHGRQLNLYRRAAAMLLGLPSARVDCFLVMMRPQVAWLVPSAEA